jgi:uncharacterized protein involved in outer membrane biogenesis
MRKLIGAFVVLVVALVVFVAVAASQLNTYLNDNKDWIAAQIEDLLNRPVQFDEVGVSLSRGLAVEIDGFRVGEDERFGAGDFLTVGRAEVRVALWPALFGKIEVTRISLRKVFLTVTRTEAGLSTDSLGAASGAEPATGPPADPGSSGAEAFEIALAEIRSGRLRYVDRTTEPPREVVIDQLEFWTSDVALARPLNFQFMGELLGDGAANLRIQGSLGPIPSAPSGPTPLDIDFSLGPIQVAALRKLPGLGDSIDPNLSLEGTMKLSGRVAGSVESPELECELDATDALLAYGEDGQKDRGAPLRVAFDVALADRNLEIRSADLEFKGIKLHARGNVVNLADPTVALVIDVFGGTVEVDGGWTQNGRLDLDVTLTDVELAEMTRSLASESAEVLDGRLSMSLAVTGTGKTWEEMKPGLEGLGEAQIHAGVLHDINLVEEALGGFTGVPGISAKLPKKMSKKYPALFSTGDSEFDRMQARVEIREGRVQILGIKLDAVDFAVRGHGSVSLDGDLEMSIRVVLSESLTKDLIRKAKPLKHLRGKDDRIEVPVRLSGILPEVSARPDTDSIAKKLGAGASRGLIEKSLGKLVKKRKKKRKRDAPASADDGRALLESLLR